MKLTALYKPGLPMRTAISIDGSGSNGRKIIEHYIAQRDTGRPSYEPVLLLTGKLSSNAVKISTEYSSRGLTLPVFAHSLVDFFRARGRDSIKEDKDMPIRSAYDNITVKVLSEFGIDCVALAGDEYVKTPVLVNTLLCVNVHPGKLSTVYTSGKNAGRPKYTGLGWIPSAKAILAGETEVCSSVHIVTDKLDCGQILSVSAPQPVPNAVLSLEDRTKLLGMAKSIQEIADFIKQHPDASAEELGHMAPLYKHAVDCQDRLKVHGDWVIYAKTLQHIAEGRYASDEKDNMYFDGKPIPTGVRL